jgi:hypothetical protein
MLDLKASYRFLLTVVKGTLQAALELLIAVALISAALLVLTGVCLACFSLFLLVTGKFSNFVQILLLAVGCSGVALLLCTGSFGVAGHIGRSAW